MTKTYEDYILEIDAQVERISKRVEAYIHEFSPKEIHEILFQAYEFAKNAHKDAVRLSGEPYISHPVAATELLLSLNPDISTIQACFLHDVIEDTEYTYEDILEIFGKDVADLCAGMSKLEKVKYRGEDRTIGSLRKMFVAMADDIRVIFIKLADRLHNMKTLMFHPNPEKRQRIALETLNIYVPIAARLGLYRIKNDLEDECFKILHPQEREELISKLSKIIDAKKEFQNSAITTLGKLLSQHDIPHTLEFRVKSPYSIYNKMLKKNIPDPEDLYDIYGIRIIVPTVADCYRVLGEIHSQYHTLPYRFKDYIALPKPNGYQSIHTTIVGFLKSFTKQPTEIQIRTQEMHKRAEIGVAAHFEYKEKGSTISTEVSWVKDLKEMVDSVGNNDLMSSLKIDTFKNRIFVFTPKGDLINLPIGSTPIDFAYHVHSQLGDHIAIAKVNGGVFPLDKELGSGDVIEIITDKNRKPSPFWLGYVKTIKAKNCIKAYLRKGDKETHRDRGREMMNKYLEKANLPFFDKDLALLRVIDGKELNMEERWQLLEQVGNFSITPASLLKRIMKAQKISYTKKHSHEKNQSAENARESEIGEKEIIIGGEENIPYRLCKFCCEHGIPEALVAHINSRGIFTVHARDCSVLKGVNKDRLMNAYIKGEESMSLFRISLVIENKIGMMKVISETLFAMEINIDELHTKKISQDTMKLSLGLEIKDYEYLIIDRFFERIKNQLGESLREYAVEQIQNIS